MAELALGLDARLFPLRPLGLDPVHSRRALLIVFILSMIHFIFSHLASLIIFFSIHILFLHENENILRAGTVQLLCYSPSS